MPPASRNRDTESQFPAQSCSFGHENITYDILTRQKTFSRLAGQGCFLCLAAPDGANYAVVVPCFKPNKHRQIIGKHIKSGIPVYEEIQSWEMACESDSETWRRLTRTCYQYQGKWKRWVPFYGITEVKEVTFRFLGVVERDNRYPINMELVDLGNVKSLCQEEIKRHPSGPYVNIDDICDGYSHSSQCQIDMEEWSQPCIQERAEKAEERLSRLQIRYLMTKCANQPEEADGIFTFEGFAQDSCIYSVMGPHAVTLPQPHERYLQVAELRGLNFVLGWQRARMAREIPFHMSLTWLCIAIIWLSALFWKVGSGDWSIALGFAQVVAASISIAATFITKGSN